MRFSRRDFIKACLAGAALGGAGIARADTTFDIECTEVPIKVKDLPPEFEDYRIGFASDFHLGGFVPDEWVAHALSLVDRAKPDVLLLGGGITKGYRIPLSQNYLETSGIDRLIVFRTKISHGPSFHVSWIYSPL